MIKRISRFFNVKHPWISPIALSSGAVTAAWRSIVVGYPSKMLWVALFLSVVAAGVSASVTWNSRRGRARSRSQLATETVKAGARMLTWPIIGFNAAAGLALIVAIAATPRALAANNQMAYMAWQIVRAYASEPVALRKADSLEDFNIRKPNDCSLATMRERERLTTDPQLPDIDKIGMFMADAGCSSRIGNEARVATDLQQLVAFPFQLWDRETGPFEIAHYLLGDERTAEFLLGQLKRQDPEAYARLVRLHHHDPGFAELARRVDHA